MCPLLGLGSGVAHAPGTEAAALQHSLARSLNSLTHSLQAAGHKTLILKVFCFMSTMQEASWSNSKAWQTLSDLLNFFFSDIIKWNRLVVLSLTFFLLPCHKGQSTLWTGVVKPRSGAWTASSFD